MSVDTASLTTQTAIEAVAWGRAPSPDVHWVNYRIVCADGFKVSVQASNRHYANDSHPSGEAAYWRGIDDEPVYPFTTFELGGIEGDHPLVLEEYESGGVWAWVPRETAAALLDEHGGAAAWEVPA